MGLQGNLKDMGVADLIQHHGQDQKTAVLHIESRDQKAVLYIKDGNVVHAICGKQEGEEAVYQALTWDSGTFNVEAGGDTPGVTISRPWLSLLLEGAKRMDESSNEPGILTENDPLFESDPTTVSKEDQMTHKIDDLLKEMSGEVDGYIASVVVGMDGIHIATHSRGKVDYDLMSAELTLLMKLIHTSVQKTGAGEVIDNLLTTENAYVMMKHLPGEEYFLAVVADKRAANIGNLRLLAKMYADRIEKVMPH